MTTTRKSSRKKTNCFEELGDSTLDNKDPDLVKEPSSITEISDTKNSDQDPNIKDGFLAFQERTLTQFSKIDTSFIDIKDSLNSLHHSYAILSSRQNPPDKYFPANNDRTTHLSHGKHSYHNDTLEDDTPFPSSTTNNLHHDPTDNEDSESEHHSPHNPDSRGIITPTAPHRFWKIIRDDNLEPHRFQSLIKGIILQDDTRQGLRHFYNKIRHVMHTSFKKHVDILPPFGELSNIPNITYLLVPSNQDYASCSLIKSVYNWFSDLIANILFHTEVINTKRAP